MRLILCFLGSMSVQAALVQKTEKAQIEDLVVKHKINDLVLDVLNAY